MTTSLHSEYAETGLTPVFRVVDSSALVAVQALIYDRIRHLLVEHGDDLPLIERLRLPFRAPPSQEDFSKFMREIDGTAAVKELVYSDAVREAFSKVFGAEDVTPFPISRFRAQFPNLGKSTYNWHQDEGTWYAVPVKELAGKMPATLWLSLNGADETNSIELIPGSHRSKLENHFKVEGQGFFNANVPKELQNVPTRIVKTEPGEGVAFHPLTFHRSVVSNIVRPRFSIDIRYYSSSATKEDAKYKVDWKFALKRFWTGTAVHKPQ